MLEHRLIQMIPLNKKISSKFDITPFDAPKPGGATTFNGPVRSVLERRLNHGDTSGLVNADARPSRSLAAGRFHTN